MRKTVLTYLILSIVGLGAAVAQNTLNPMTNRDRFGNQIDPNSQPDNLEDSTNTEIQSLPPKLYMWKLSETLGDRTLLPADTASLNFQNSNLVGGMNGEYNFLGNLGSPRLSRIFFHRQTDDQSIFLQPFSSFYVKPSEMKFTNSNIPFTNLTYYKAGSKVDGEERFKTYFSVNANKRLAFGFNIDYLYGRGFYANQATSFFNGGLFASYIGDHYQLQAIYNNFFLKMNENGGITDDQYITKPENMAEGKKQYEASNIPVRLDRASNRNHDFYIYLTHRYRLGFTRRMRGGQVIKEERRLPKGAASDTLPADSTLLAHADTIGHARPLTTDSIATTDKQKLLALTSPDEGQRMPARPADRQPAIPEGRQPAESALPAAATDTTLTEEFVPVTSFIHTLKVERSSHRFRASGEPSGFFPEQSYLASGESNDSTTAFSVKNTLGIALLEGFNKYAKAGLTAYVTHRFSRYDLMNIDPTVDLNRIRYDEQEVYVGGELAKREGSLLHYNVNGEVGVMDKAAGQFRVDANFDLNFRLGKDTVNFYARGYIHNTLPTFYMRHYHSNHYAWDIENPEKELRTRIEGELNINRWHTNLRAGVENLKNYTYFDGNALPQQYSGNIQVLSACLKQDFHLGIFHLENEVTWQKSSEENILPLPDLSLYHNFYILTRLAKKVLTVQLGADVRYFSKYYAPDYAPGIQQFHLQKADNQIEIGGYPIVNAYANLQLKRTRIFVMMSHVNAGMGNKNYFLVPHYPINPKVLKIGLSWNFYD